MVTAIPLPKFCYQCQAPIVRDDDEAGVCIPCGGRNRRMTAALYAEECARVNAEAARAAAEKQTC